MQKEMNNRKKMHLLKQERVGQPCKTSLVHLTTEEAAQYGLLEAIFWPPSLQLK